MTDQELLPSPPGAEDAITASRPSGRRWSVGNWLVLVASLGWLVFVVAHLVLSGRAWVWAPLDLIPPVLFVAIPLLLLAVAPFARPIRWRVMAVLVVAGLVGAGNSGINLASLWYDPPPAPPGAITVVSLNTEFWDQDWRADWSTGGEGFEPNFYTYLRELDADIYLLKEYLYLDRFAPTVHEMAVHIDRLPRLRRELPGYEIAVSGEQITLSRFPIVGSRGLDLRPWLPEHLATVPAALVDFPESYTVETLRTDIDVNGTVVSFYNTHVHQPPHEWNLLSGEAREVNRYNHDRRQASYRALSADIDGNDNPVLVGADLNTSPAMGELRLLPDRLVDHTNAVSSIYPHTWLVGGYRLWRIDWLLSTPDIAVHRYELFDPEGMSDHRVQEAVVSVREDAQ